MSANGISSTSKTKEQRQVEKLEYSQAKRKGQIITEGSGTWSADGVDNDAVNWYRPNNTYDITTLPDTYNGNVPGADDNPNTDGLLPKRPWVAVGAIAAPTSIAEAVDGGTLVDLQVWYDAADTATFIPGAIDESTINQWTDKSNFAHNANPTNGNAKPTYEDTVLVKGYGYVEFDGTEAFSINPIAWAQGIAGFTAFVVARPTSEANGDTIMTTNTGDFKISRNSTTWTVGMNTGTATPTSNINSLNTWGIFTLVYNAANPLVFRYNRSGVTLGAYTPPATSSSSNGTLYIGHDGSSTAYTGGMAEIILFNKALNATEYANVENYLYTKWLAP